MIRSDIKGETGGKGAGRKREGEGELDNRTARPARPARPAKAASDIYGIVMAKRHAVANEQTMSKVVARTFRRRMCKKKKILAIQHHAQGEPLAQK